MKAQSLEYKNIAINFLNKKTKKLTTKLSTK